MFSQLATLARLGERDRRALAPGPSDATDAVHVALGRRRHVVVDDVGERVDVEAAGGDVGGDEQFGGAVAEAGHHAVALALVHAAVQRLGAVAAPVHRLGELVDLGARAAEHERRLRRLDVEDATERVRLVRPLHPVHGLADERLVARLGLGAADLDLHRIALVALGDRVDPVRAASPRTAPSGGRPACSARIDSMSSVKPMSSISSASSRITVRIAVELQRAAPDVVDRAARRGDDDVDASVEQSAAGAGSAGRRTPGRP